jgi:hypothetical protein
VPRAGRQMATDFGRIPVFSRDAATRPAAGLASRLEFDRERSIELPRGGEEEEERTVDYGTPTESPSTPAWVPGTPAESPGTPDDDPSAPALAGCDCVPRGVEIKNVSPYRDGPLYGHKFDVAVALTYVAAPAGRTGQDAQLLWFERSDRPAKGHGISPDVWTDLFALFPDSPTFDGWTRNRTKPCPGLETATIHDPPATSVNRPARTLEFDISVRGRGITENARAKQVLEPDGAGGIKTQSFEILPPAPGPGAGP